ncbi:hypothetical protein GCM10011391_19640 [Pullulanibacillus camelliae]|uniref:Uncharacterized protein n=1 Tax=Pullulanibacillus camelliae TaxID=1707096 RepID=A0A8J2YGS4_9BACL|nr:DUF5325 family protein [Pullulanibacillus camelliae]GGE40986.1 hypothetical protein GCM10011391_19640 [Pullulanibacillus camelliae]
MNALFFLLAVLTVASLVAIGYGIAIASPLATILSIIGVFVFMGLGFTLKRKLRASNS